ncbi:TonB-dependent receptor [Sphingomonas sp. dw_22]|uniref:TonB-dependent receptor n=1 Tax=Sphingomonas sp. dw_22 TaxID=2721175 RepID=UPI001BD39FC1|nr:TonB-dependent receptor [Sphingomonas sp. dw_22]
MRSFAKRLACSASILALADLGTAAAHAQTARTSEQAADQTNVGEIVVTARRSIETPPEQIKRTATGVVDSTTATEIEKTTDTTLAEALERVVGVSSDAFYGTSDAGYVSIRGFDSRYNSMEIDGNPIWFSSQNNRGAQINMFPAAIVKETSVYKTVTPDQDANSIGGHIALRTLRAFDGGSKPYFTVGGRIGFYDQESKVHDTPSGSIYGAGKFTFGPEGRLGVVIGGNYQRYAGSDIYGGVDTYTQASGHDQVGGNLYFDSAYDRYTENTALYAKVELQATDSLYAFVSGNYFDETKELYLQREDAYIASGGARTITQTGPGTADFAGGEGQIREYDYNMQRRAKVVGAGLDYRMLDKGVLVLRANYTDFYNDVLTRNLGDGIRLSGLNGSYDLNGDVPDVTPADAARYDNTANWVFRNTAASSGSASYNRDQILEDKVTSVRGDFNWNNHATARGLGAAAGASWTRLDRGFDQTQRFYSLPASYGTLTLAQIAPAGATMADNDAIKMDWNSFWDILHANGTVRTDLAPTTDYALIEDVAAAHAELTFAGAGFHLLAGMRYEHTDDTTHTANLVSNVVTPVRRDFSYGNWLPNVQATFDATRRLKLRAAFTKTLGRPDFADFAPGLTTTFDSNGVQVNNGTNPHLRPRISTNYDASVEYYLDDGVLSIALFHKDIAGETFSERTENRDASGQLTSIDTIPLNTGSARVTGVEVTAAKRRFGFLPAPFDRLGLSANFTWLDGTWNVVFTDGTTRAVDGLRNQPKWLANLQASYDAGPFDLNVNYRMRGRSFTGTFGTTSVGDRWIDGYDALDVKLSIKLLGQLSASIEARNLTDSYIRQTTGTEDSVYNSVGAGRSYFAGLRFRY